MSRERGWLQTCSGLALFLLFLMVLPACKPLIEVTVHAQCAPEAMKENDAPGCKINPLTGKCK